MNPLVANDVLDFSKKTSVFHKFLKLMVIASYNLNNFSCLDFYLLMVLYDV